jgi:hypothetical protein
MAFVHVNPHYRQALAELGLVEASDFLGLPGVIYSGHPGRNVSRVCLGRGELVAFLKQEHRVPRRERLTSAWAGFGFVSKSCREYQLLCALAEAGVGCPEPLAAGEDDHGRAFLLTRAIEGALDLRAFLRELADRPRLRQSVARQLGAALAHLHRAGFDHPDLFAKHVLVTFDPDAERATFHFLDWQRSRRRRPSWPQRLRDLAALDATLAEDLVGPGDRLLCLRSYLQHSAPAPRLAWAAGQCARRSAALLRRRRVRELRQPPLPAGMQNLIRVDGEALCVTRQFRDAVGGRLPEYLCLASQTRGQSPLVQRLQVAIAPGRQAVLVRRSASLIGQASRSWLGGWRLTSPELEQAGTLFRLQRYGLTAPVVLAVGQKRVRPWRSESFLLTEPPADTVGLLDGLARCEVGEGIEALARRRRLLRECATVLRQVHDASCYLSDCPDEELAAALGVQGQGGAARVVLASPDAVRRKRRPGRRLARRDVRRLHALLCRACGRTDALRFVLAYERRSRRSERPRFAAVKSPLFGWEFGRVGL